MTFSLKGYPKTREFIFECKMGKGSKKSMRRHPNVSPKRTIVFASWAAEECGLLGSYEWVTDKLSKIMGRMVGVVNTDICSTGPIARPQVSERTS